MPSITGPLFKCFGSKWLSSKHLPPPEYPTVIEPFAGGAGYSLRHYEKNIRLYERDTHVRELWEFLIVEATESIIRDIPINVPEGTDIRTLDLRPGAALLLKHWQRTNNVGNCWTISSWGHLPGMWTANCRARVAEEHQAIKHWLVNGSDWTEAFQDHHGYEATWLVDPPYEFNYKYRQPPIEYTDLAEKCISAKGQVVVCEATDPENGNVPDWLPFQPWAKRINSRRGPGKRSYSMELLCELDNGPDTDRVPV